MTYRDMTLSEFAIEIGLPANNPFTIQAFEDLCATEEQERMSQQTS